MDTEVAEPVAMTAQSATTTAFKCVLIIGGMMLYLTNVKRDSNFYHTILENEVFPRRTTALRSASRIIDCDDPPFAFRAVLDMVWIW